MPENARELQRLKALVARLSDEQLAAMVNEYWSVAGILGHIAFWDGCALFLAGKLQRGEPLTAANGEPGCRLDQRIRASFHPRDRTAGAGQPGG